VRGLVIAGIVPALMASVSVAFPVPLAFVALRVTEEVPAVVGVPLMSPVVVLTERPAGSPVASYEVGLLVAVI
jgi:hypothetical protein